MFDESLARLAQLSDADLLRPAWTFRGRPSELRYALYHALEEEQRAAIEAPSAAGEAARIAARDPDHSIGVERSYRANSEYSVARTASDPVLMPVERRPPADPADTAGGVAEIVTRVALRRAETDASLAALSDAALARPTMWGGFEVDVRHRLHRFASHIAEHTGQCESAIRTLDAFGGDARAIAKRMGAMRGLHERSTHPAKLGVLDRALQEKAASAER